MKLNDLESKFFDRILNAELDVPVHATLEYEENTFDIIVVPEITPEGYFKLKYFNAPAYDPEPQLSESGGSFKSWSLDGEFFGAHPLLTQAWERDEPVTLQLHTSPLPSQPSAIPKLDARVLFAGTEHRGELAVHQNQIATRDFQLTETKFCVVDFPDFVTPEKELNSISGVSDPQTDQYLRLISSRLGGDATIIVRPARRNVLLDSGDEWKIWLKKDEQQTRDLVGHTGVIEKNDGSEYDPSELSDVLNGLKYFFAFTAGAYRHPTVVIGYDSKGQPIWGQIGRFDMDRHNTTNWFDNSRTVPYGAVLECLFPGYWRKWREKRSEIIAVVESYVHSSEMKRAGATKDAVAKSYAGLEILASLIAKKTIERRAGEEIDKVLAYCEVPNRLLTEDIAPITTRLCAFLDVSDRQGAHLLNSVRNYVAHPLDTKTQAEIKELHLNHLDVDPMNYVHLHDLSQFYLEYLFLKFCAYRPSDYRPLLEQLGRR